MGSGNLGIRSPLPLPLSTLTPASPQKKNLRRASRKASPQTLRDRAARQRRSDGDGEGRATPVASTEEKASEVFAEYQPLVSRDFPPSHRSGGENRVASPSSSFWHSQIQSSVKRLG